MVGKGITADEATPTDMVGYVIGESLHRIIFTTLPACLLVALFYGFSVPPDRS